MLTMAVFRLSNKDTWLILHPAPRTPIRERLGYRTHPDTHPLSTGPAQAGPTALERSLS